MIIGNKIELDLEWAPADEHGIADHDALHLFQQEGGFSGSRFDGDGHHIARKLLRSHVKDQRKLAKALVRTRVFDLYSAGVGPRSIAAMLNDEGVAAPRGRQWNGSTINGNDKRGYGILRNSLYVGKIVWNRVRMVKDPSTGRRISRENEETAVETIDAPHLRIIDDALFQAVRSRKEAIGGKHAHTAPRNRRLLSGLLKCRACGGGLSIIGADRSGPRVSCSTWKESKSCSNNARYYVQKIERDVIDRLRIMFADTSAIDAYVEEYRAESKRIATERRNSRGAKERAGRRADQNYACD
ncbi:recombinase family protein [Rhizobium lusitanum]|nr:recombinase family protein [Rhizobium lusitanum]